MQASDTRHTLTVTAENNGDRLDALLALLFPETGIRARRRLWEHCTITVNGVPRAAGYRTQTGDVIDIVCPCRNKTQHILPAAQAEVLCRTADYAAIFKPEGLHSARIAASPAPSVEDQLDSLFAGETPPVLVNRLDRPTSGMVLAAFGSHAAEAFRKFEQAGQVEKLYLAVVLGHMKAPVACRNELNMQNRQVTTVLPHEAQDPLRHTTVLPLRALPAESMDGQKTTLVLAAIHRGARHQIRAHLAHAGHPIAGDCVYGSNQADGTLYLHHFKIDMPGFSCTCPPRWPLWPQWAAGTACATGRKI
jgi:23S rRNA pseudouridine1911/1915/1917 synthase